MVTWPDVVNIAPDVATAPVGAQTIILAYVDDALDATRWGGKYTLGACLLCAHLALVTVRAGFGASGPVVSEAVGDVSVSYAAYIGGAADDLDMTPYGRLYRRLARQVGMGGFVCG